MFKLSEIVRFSFKQKRSYQADLIVKMALNSIYGKFGNGK